MRSRRLRRWAAAVVLGLSGVSAIPGSGTAAPLLEGVPYGRSRTVFVVSAGGGWSGSVTEMAVKDFPSTTFEGGDARSLSLRYTRVRRGEDTNVGFALDIGWERGDLDLVEQGVSLGTVRTSNLVVTPGVQWWSDEYGGAGLFVGLVGVGRRSASFEEGPGVRALELDTGADVTVRVGDGWYGTLFPCKLDVPLGRRVAAGVAFSGLVLANAETDWLVDGYPVPGISTLYMSGWRFQFTLSALSF